MRFGNRVLPNVESDRRGTTFRSRISVSVIELAEPISYQQTDCLARTPQWDLWLADLRFQYET